MSAPGTDARQESARPGGFSVPVTFYRSVAGHEDAGMKGKSIVS